MPNIRAATASIVFIHVGNDFSFVLTTKNAHIKMFRNKNKMCATLERMKRVAFLAFVLSKTIKSGSSSSFALREISIRMTAVMNADV
mmetsp:Transcript_20243/g.32520  ORF Transcript_20243/g.32520 Transcript_20243/m.32520 type:complete len:87 (-) Transcript_20243:230-490(-)